LYQLDASKVGRLASGTTNSISPYRVRDLLGLSAEYYISIKIFPLLNMSFEKISDELFSVKLSNQWGVSVSNINVTAAYTNTCVSNITAADITSFMDNALQNATYASNMTNALGTCTLNFQGAGARSSLLVMAGRYSIKCLTSWPTLSEYILVEVESSMGSPSNFEVETTYRNVEINGLSYVARLTMWR
jgi:hypothetical protein